MVRGTVALPAGSGKNVRVLVFAKGAAAEAAKAAGAEFVGFEDLIKKVTEGFQDFDVAVATPEAMAEVRKLGRVLGPRGLMPNPKTGTVTDDTAKAVKECKAGRVEFKLDKAANLHVPCGKFSFKPADIEANGRAVIEAIVRSRPAGGQGPVHRVVHALVHVSRPASASTSPRSSAPNPDTPMRPEKNFIIDEIKSRVDQTPYVLLTDYTGMQVPQFNELRNRLAAPRPSCAWSRTRSCAARSRTPTCPTSRSYLHGQSAVVLGESDVSAAAKVLKNFAAEFQKPKIKVGILDKAVLEPADIMALADLPSKEVLQAKLLGLLLAPASTLVRLINTPASQVAQVLKAYSDKGEPINKSAAKEEPKAEAAPEAPEAEAAPAAVEAAPAEQAAPAAEAAPAAGEATT